METPTSWYPVRGMIQFAYHTLRQIWKKMILVKPKIIGDIYAQDMQRFIDNPGEMADVVGDIVPFFTTWNIRKRLRNSS